MKNHLVAAILSSALTVVPTFASSSGEGILIEAQLFNAFDPADFDGAQRIEAAVLLRVFSQEMAAAACHLAFGVDAVRAKKLLRETRLKITALLDALEFGSKRSGIVGPETQLGTLEMIRDLRQDWAPVQAANTRLSHNPQDAEALAQIKTGSDVILTKASLLISEISGRYAHPHELMQSDVMLLDFAGRQATKTQRMSRIACEIRAGDRARDRLEQLSEIMQLYELTLTALLKGMPEVGLKPAPTPEIRAHLEKAMEDWAPIKANLETVRSREPVSKDLRATLYSQLIYKKYHMEDLEKMYVKYSGQQ